MRFVFKEWTVVVVTTEQNTSEYQNLLKPQGFGSLEFVNGAVAWGDIEKHKPNLIVLGKEIPKDKRLKLLKIARQTDSTKQTPLLIAGSTEETAPGNLADKVHAVRLAKMLPLPMDQKKFNLVVVEFLDPLIDQNKEKSYNVIAQAKKLIKTDLEKSAVKYAEGLNIYDKNAVAWSGFAGVLSELGRRDEAEIAYLKSLEINQFNLKTYFALAVFYEQREDFDLAIGILKQALGIAVILKSPEKTHSRITYHMGRLGLKLKRLPEAEESFNQAIESNPEDAQLRADIGDAYAENGYYEESEKHYQAALDIDPNMAHVFNRLGIAYRKQKKYGKAIELFINARQHRPEDENLMFNTARTHFEAGNLFEAETLLEEALKKYPNFKEAKRLLVKIRSGKRVIELEP